MRLLKIFLLSGFLFSFQFPVSGQATGLVGSWQLVKQGSCLDEGSAGPGDSLAALRSEMHTRTGSTAQVVNFRPNSSGDESTRILNSARSANTKKFFYKFDGEILLILDKRSQTISDSYIVDKFTADSLILSNASRPCETKIFVKIEGDQPN